MPEYYPKYPSGKQVLEYINDYVNKYKLNNNIKLNSLMVNLKFSDNYWKVTYINSNKQYIIKTKYISICSGIFNKYKEFNIKNRSNYFGKIIYPKNIDTCKFDKDSEITIIGNGASCIDVIKSISIFKKINVLYNSEKWYMLDKIWNLYTYKFLNRVSISIGRIISINLFLVIFYIICKFIFKVPVNLPDNKFNSKNIVMCNNHIFELIRKKKIIFINKSIKYVYKNNIILDDDSFLKSNTIIVCTGYETEKIIDKNIDELYHHIIHPELYNCGFIGFTKSYNWLQVSEIQAKWYLNFILGKIAIPKNLIESIIIEKKNKNDDLDFNDLTYYSFTYCDSLIEEIENNKIERTISYWLKNPKY